MSVEQQTTAKEIHGTKSIAKQYLFDYDSQKQYANSEIQAFVSSAG